ncbi:MAG: hypothetical protein GTN89_05655 [Acidobacteria bacterium]|nr:hypothetical protein [Acidobacteriota bacterium]NIM61374.1 hypothetical protein [Acidobacteriota bacterium]NIO58809.1 hypothetical protein [Acidobacteriota bacterium]NIQ29853.1 hypothetical protein [Acidobacteriota bacterium]NIQ84586.1 hypothetical protein [Acidobacteriota bacterium]
MRRTTRVGVLLAIGCAFATMALQPAAQEAASASSIELPVSFERVWFRPADSGLAGGKQSGLLTVSEQGLEFSAKKQSHVLPWSRVEMISYGAMSGDTDTKWVVLALNPVAEQWSFIGYRDGRKMGYGGDTPKIFDAVVEGARRAGAGPFAVPEGTSTYITPGLQFTVALPNGWHASVVSSTLVDGRPLWGSTIFAPLDLEAARKDPAGAERATEAILAAAEPAVFLDRFEAGEGFSCRKLGRAGRRRLLDRITTALRPMRLTTELQWTAEPHRYCSAWRATARASRKEAEIDLVFYAVSDGVTAYLFTTRSPGGGAVEPRFDLVSRSLRTAVAR